MRTTSCASLKVLIHKEARHALGACLVAASWGGVLCILTRSPLTRRTDFFYYFCASKLVAQGHGAHIYDTRALGALERSLAYPIRVPGGVIPNVYPPFFTAALAPLTALPYSLAYLVWLLMNCVLLGLSMLFLERYARLGRTGTIVFRFAAVLLVPVWVALLLGQVSLILLALLCITLGAARAGMHRTAGIALGVTLIKPQYALPFLLVFVLQGHWKTVGAFAVTALVLFLLPIPVLGWSTDVSYVHTLTQSLGWGRSVGGFAPEVNRSFAGFTQLLFQRPIATAVSIVLDLVALVAVVTAARTTNSVDVPFGLATVVSLLASQHVLIHDLAVLLIPAAIAWRYRMYAPRGTLVLGMLAFASLYVGFSLSFTRPIQLPTLTMTAVATWLFVIAARTSRGRLALPASQVSSDGARLPSGP